jgi:hypothetical protein
MIGKRLIAASSLLVFTMASGSAFAGVQHTRKGWQPSQTLSMPAARSAEATAYAQEIVVTPDQAAPYRYHGGPHP